MSPVRTARHDTIFVIIAETSPANALGASVRDGIEAALREGLADEDITAMVLGSDGATFFGGADDIDVADPADLPGLRKLIDTIEASARPVVAAIRGKALGGGFELALGCHYRIAAPSAWIGMPAVKLGLVPGAGGSQRIPRLAGVEPALEMLALGGEMSARQALDAGLVDRLAGEGDPLADAVAFAKEVAPVRPLPRASERTAAPAPDAVESFGKTHARRFRGFDAPLANIHLVEVASSDAGFAEGIAAETEALGRLTGGVQAAAQRHILIAKRRAARIDDVPAGTPLRPIARVGVIGAGTMGGGISMNFLAAGIPVTIVETAQEALDKGVGIIRANYENSARRGRFTPDQVERMMALLTPSLSLDDLSDCDLIIEAIYENMAAKKDLFGRIDTIARPGAILASNTSFLDIDEMAAMTKRPADVLGMHFFSPANVMKLLEMVRGAKTAPEVLATVMALASRIGKVAVVSGVCHGFIGNRMLAQRQAPSTGMLMKGALPHQIDAAHTGFGMPMGPFQMADLAGVDIGWHRDPTRIESIQDALSARGRWGQKTAKGFYDYDERRNPVPSLEVTEILDEFRRRSNAEGSQAAFTDDEILAATVFPMVNEGARIIEEGIAQRASDIDVVWVYGFGWPAYRGGPMFWANTIGLDTIVAGLERNGVAVAPLLRRKAEAGEAF